MEMHKSGTECFSI